MSDRDFELVPGVESKPFFLTELAYRDFCERFAKEVEPELERQRIARAKSIDDAMKHWVD